MREPLMRNDHLPVCPETRLDLSNLPLPEDHVALAVSPADSLSLGREVHLARVPCDRVAGETLVADLAEVVRAVNQDLVVHTLRSRILLCAGGRMSALSLRGIAMG